MQVLTPAAAGTIHASAPFAVMGGKLTGAGADAAQLQDGAAREILRFETVAGSPSDFVMLQSPIMVNGLIVVGLAGASVLQIFIE